MKNRMRTEQKIRERLKVNELWRDITRDTAIDKSMLEDYQISIRELMWVLDEE